MIVVWTGRVVTAGRLGITATGLLGRTGSRRGSTALLLVLSSNGGILGTERDRRSDGDWIDVERPFDHHHHHHFRRRRPHDDGIPSFDYIYTCVCIYTYSCTRRHGRLAPWDEIFGIARTF